MNHRDRASSMARHGKFGHRRWLALGGHLVSLDPVMNPRRWTVAALALAAAACGGVEPEEEPPNSAAAPRLVGRVGSVNPAEGFVLVESYGEFSLGEGLLLSGVGGEGRTASLLVTGERMGRFVAADVKSGEVEAGDLVYARPLPDETSVDGVDGRQEGGNPQTEPSVVP